MPAQVSVQFLIVVTWPLFSGWTVAAKSRRHSQTTGKPCNDCQSNGISKSTEITAILIICILLLILIAIILSRYYARKNLLSRVQKQVQSFDELMEKTRMRNKMIRDLQKRHGTEDKSKTAISTTRKLRETSPTTSHQKYYQQNFCSVSDKSTAIWEELHPYQRTDEYGRNIARIQTHRSLLYENAVEIKKVPEPVDEQDECFNQQSSQSPVEKPEPNEKCESDE